MSNDRPGRGPRQRSATTPAQRTKRAEPTRYAAFHLLRAVDEGAYANLELPKILRRHRLHGRDAGFATELAFGTLRNRGLYDAVIVAASGRALSAIDTAALDVLRLGAHQLLGMRVPVHAAADQTVGLARSVVGAGAAGFVNAVLRRVSEKSREEWVAQVTQGDQPPTGTSAASATTALGVEMSHPEWIVKAMRQALLGHGAADAGDVDASLRALLEADNEPPKVSLVARPGLTTVEDLVRGTDGFVSETSPIGVVLDSGDPGDIAAVRDGRAAVQDEGSQLLSVALANVPVPESLPARWLDLCAGPGGKSGVFGALATESGNDFVAIEVSPHRADLVRSTLTHLVDVAHAAGQSVQVRTADGRLVGEDEPAAYAKVLVDAPCTGLGALRRRPEARWRRQPKDLVELGPLQRALLHSAIDATSPGGVIGYATCSPHLAETTFVVRDVTKKRDDVEIVDAREFFQDASGHQLSDLGEGPFVQLWPHLHGTDGMFFALLRRRESASDAGRA